MTIYTKLFTPSAMFAVAGVMFTVCEKALKISQVQWLNSRLTSCTRRKLYDFSANAIIPPGIQLAVYRTANIARRTLDIPRRDPNICPSKAIKIRVKPITIRSKAIKISRIPSELSLVPFIPTHNFIDNAKPACYISTQPFIDVSVLPVRASALLHSPEVVALTFATNTWPFPT